MKRSNSLLKELTCVSEGYRVAKVQKPSKRPKFTNTCGFVKNCLHLFYSNLIRTTFAETKLIDYDGLKYIQNCEIV